MQDPLCVFMKASLAFYADGKLDGVVCCENHLTATREDSTPIEFSNITADPQVAREALARAIVYAEARNPKPFTPNGIEGRDFLIAETE